jgi:hypothetical protein
MPLVQNSPKHSAAKAPRNDNAVNVSRISVAMQDAVLGRNQGKFKPAPQFVTCEPPC